MLEQKISVLLKISPVLKPDDPIWKAWRSFKTTQLRCLPVADNGRPLGVLRERDLSLISKTSAPHELLVEDVMDRDVPVVASHMSIRSVIDKILSAKVYVALVSTKPLPTLVTLPDLVEILFEGLNERANQA